jgi:hypothetical protein
MATNNETRASYYVAAAVAVVIVLLLIIFYAIYRRHPEATGFTPYTKQIPGNPQHYEYDKYLKARGGHGNREYDYNRGHDHGAGGVSRVPFNQFDGYYSAKNKEGMSVGAHWQTMGSYGHTGATLPAFDLSGYYGNVPTPPRA